MREAGEGPWQLVPLADYRLPGESQPAVLHKKGRSLIRLLRGTEDDALARDAEDALRALPNVRLENLAPPIDWAPAAAALQRAISAPDGGVPPGVRFLIGQPYGGHADILEHWAEAQGAERLATPSAGQILAQDMQWPGGDRDLDRPWVLPGLERCFLRHTDGLALLRGFLGQALSGALGAGVIGCDSWAWAFIQRAWPMPQARALTLQAFDGRALADFFLTPAGEGPGRVEIRSARSGRPLLPANPADAVGDEVVSPELRELAAHCRGNLGIAWHYWRKRLRAAPETGQADEVSAAQPGPGTGDADVLVWLAPEMGAPVLPHESAEDVVFILHALLLHEGLPAELLAELLPLTYSQILSRLLQLQSHEIVDHRDGVWRVAALAYPTVRETLRTRSYLTDAF